MDLFAWLFLLGMFLFILWGAVKLVLLLFAVVVAYLGITSFIDWVRKWADL